jgi:hypothetical protein
VPGGRPLATGLGGRNGSCRAADVDIL